MIVRITAKPAASLVLLGLLIVSALPLFPQNSSPFLPPTTPRAKQQPSISTKSTKPLSTLNTTLELRGIMQWEDTWYFSIYDKTDRESHWITKAAGVEEKNIRVNAWDEPTNKLRLKVHGKEVELKLKKQSDVPLPIAGRVSPAKRVAPKPTRPKIPRGNIPPPTPKR